MTDPLVRRIFGVTFHFSLSLKICSHILGCSNFIVLNSPTTMRPDGLGYECLHSAQCLVYVHLGIGLLLNRTSVQFSCEDILETLCTLLSHISALSQFVLA